MKNKKIITNPPKDLLKEAEDLMKDINLEKLLSQMTLENMPDFSEFDDSPVGKERWWENE